jgi:hypothetical protein
MTTENPGIAHGSEHGHHGCCAAGAVESESLHALEKAEGELHAAEAVLEHALEDVKRATHAVEEAEEAIEKAHRIHFTVDGEQYETSRREWTPNQIIVDFGGGKDPATHYLVEIDGHHKKSFQGKGDEEFQLHDCARFQVICTGPTPVSNGSQRTGVEPFISGLKLLGYEPTQLPNHPDHVTFDYVVETGKFAGRCVRLGLIIPQDFPLTPPSGPHVSPGIHPINPNGDHPTGGVHDSHSAMFRSVTKQDWQYWSRPHRSWSKRTVGEYMSHVWHLWDSQ